jgi:7,8-dihydropterin-6-yl-methyl-4-(beta-D-ribofuranosyl)aminobenzene 5'-phosphate synthase
LSFLIKTDTGSILFDAGQTGAVLSHNLDLLDSAPRGIVGLVLSHAHVDHTGGLAAALALKPDLSLYASPDIFRPRYVIRGGEYESIGLPMTREDLAKSADLRLSEIPTEVVPGVWTTGEITNRLEPEGRSVRHVVPNGADWQRDPYRDDMSMVVETQRGLAVLCGCCHAGLLNTLARVHQMFQRPIVEIVGGTHLIDADAMHLQDVIEVLRGVYGSPRLHFNHCTGERAYIALANAFGNQVSPFPAGTILALS